MASLEGEPSMRSRITNMAGEGLRSFFNADERNSRVWKDRRSRLAVRKYGGIKDYGNEDSNTALRKPSLWQYGKEGFHALKDRVRPPEETVDMGLDDRFIREPDNVDSVVRVQKALMDEIDDYRPYFTYWITTIQCLIMALALYLYPISNVDFYITVRKGLIMTQSLAKEQVEVYEPSNIWIGPKPADLIRLGAAFSPCMRPDHLIDSEIQADRDKEGRDSGCCITNYGGGCVQTTEDKCSPLLSTFRKWGPNEVGPGGRLSGPVCGQDPRFCLSPSSTPPHAWDDDIRNWPICRNASTLSLGQPPHMLCDVKARPCCVGIHGLLIKKSISCRTFQN